MIQVGDLVRFKFPDNIAGALTALKVAKRMEARINCRTGLALEIRGGNILVNFEGDVILVHIMFLEVINEKR